MSESEDVELDGKSHDNMHLISEEEHTKDKVVAKGSV